MPQSEINLDIIIKKINESLAISLHSWVCSALQLRNMEPYKANGKNLGWSIHSDATYGSKCVMETAHDKWSTLWKPPSCVQQNCCSSPETCGTLCLTWRRNCITICSMAAKSRSCQQRKKASWLLCSRKIPILTLLKTCKVQWMTVMCGEDSSVMLDRENDQSEVSNYLFLKLQKN